MGRQLFHQIFGRVAKRVSILHPHKIRCPITKFILYPRLSHLSKLQNLPNCPGSISILLGSTNNGPLWHMSGSILSISREITFHTALLLEFFSYPILAYLLAFIFLQVHILWQCEHHFLLEFPKFKIQDPPTPACKESSKTGKTTSYYTYGSSSVGYCPVNIRSMHY